MTVAAERERTLLVIGTSGMNAYRAVFVTVSTKTAAYPGPGQAANAITITEPKLRHDGVYTIEVVMLSQIHGTRFIETGAAVSAGDQVEVMDSFGRVKTLAIGSALDYVKVWDAAGANELCSLTKIS